MKITKRIATLLLTVCLIVPCFSVFVQAADGVIFFTDLETKVGDTFTVTGTVVAKGSVVGDVTVHMSYDTNYIRFMEGDGVNADSNGGLTFQGSGDGSSERLEFTMTFQALQEGSTRMEQGTASVSTYYGDRVDCESGYSDIVIGAGDPGKITDVSEPAGGTGSVIIDEEQYTISEEFSELEIPSGFAAAEVSYNGETYQGAVQSLCGLSMLYLVDSAQEGAFWMYDAGENSFSPVEEIMISDEYSIIVYDGRNEVKMPSKYEENEIDINGKTFPVWEDPDRSGFYILYAVNNEGHKSLYIYDSEEHTYQRMETPKTAATENKSVGMWDKIAGFITDYLIWFIVGVGCTLFLALVFLIVLAVKLRHRNLELDDLYDEYGIDSEDENMGNQPKASGGSREQLRKEEHEFDEDYVAEVEYEDEYDDDYIDEDEFDDLADLRNEFESSEKSGNYDDYYDDEDFSDTADLGRIKKSEKVKEDTFEMDFIDLD